MQPVKNNLFFQVRKQVQWQRRITTCPQAIASAHLGPETSCFNSFLPVYDSNMYLLTAHIQGFAIHFIAIN